MIQVDNEDRNMARLPQDTFQLKISGVALTARPRFESWSADRRPIQAIPQTLINRPIQIGAQRCARPLLLFTLQTPPEM